MRNRDVTPVSCAASTLPAVGTADNPQDAFEAAGTGALNPPSSDSSTDSTVLARSTGVPTLPHPERAERAVNIEQQRNGTLTEPLTGEGRKHHTVHGLMADWFIGMTYDTLPARGQLRRIVM